MMTKQQAKKLMRRVNAQIDSYVCSVQNLTETMLNLGNACEIFVDDSARAESDWNVASRNSFYSQHVEDAIEDLSEMREWYEKRLEIEERKLRKLREFLNAGNNTGTNTVKVTFAVQNSATEEEIDMDGVTFCNGEFYSVHSFKYHAEFFKDFSGKIHYFIFDETDTDTYEDETYSLWDYEVSREKFFSTLKQRGAFTEGNDDHTAGTIAAEFKFDVQRFATDEDGFNRDEFGNCDFSYNIYGVLDAGLTEDEIDDYTNRIRAALSENGNICHVSADENLIGISANAGGNIKKFLDIVGELYQRDCFLEFDRAVDENGDWLQQEVGGYEWEWLESLCTDNPLPRPNPYGDDPRITEQDAPKFTIVLEAPPEFFDLQRFTTDEPAGTRLYPNDVRELWLSQEWEVDYDIKAEDEDCNEVELTQEDFDAIEKTLRGRYYISWDNGIVFFAEGADWDKLGEIFNDLGKRGAFIYDCFTDWTENKEEADTW